MTWRLAERDSYAGHIGQSKEENMNSKWWKVEVLAAMKHFLTQLGIGVAERAVFITTRGFGVETEGRAKPLKHPFFLNASSVTSHFFHLLKTHLRILVFSADLFI